MKLILQEELGKENMGALFKFFRLIFCFSIFLTSCANADEVVGCSYKFSDNLMVDKFKKVMSQSPQDREIYDSENGKFSVKRLNCNYYVTFNLEPMRIDGRALLIFDSAGEVISSSVR